MAKQLYVIDNYGNELWRRDSDSWVKVEDLPHGLGKLTCIASHLTQLSESRHQSLSQDKLYIVDSARNRLWRRDLSGWVRVEDLPSGLNILGITSHKGKLYIVDVSRDGLWRRDLSGWVKVEDLPSKLIGSRGITSHKGKLYIVDDSRDRLWRRDLSGWVRVEDLPSGLTGPRGITSHEGKLYIVDYSEGGLWRRDSSSWVKVEDLPHGLGGPRGITSQDLDPPIVINVPLPVGEQVRDVDVNLTLQLSGIIKLIELNTSRGSLRFTDAPTDIRWDGFIWSAYGGIVQIEDIRETIDWNSQRVRLTLSGAGFSIAQRVRSEGLRGRIAHVWRARYNPVTGSIEGDPHQDFTGLCSSNWQFRHIIDPEHPQVFNITTDILSRLSLANNASPIRTNIASHQEMLRRLDLPFADQFYEFVPGLIGLELFFGGSGLTQFSIQDTTITNPNIPIDF